MSKRKKWERVRHGELFLSLASKHLRWWHQRWWSVGDPEPGRPCFTFPHDFLPHRLKEEVHFVFLFLFCFLLCQIIFILRWISGTSFHPGFCSLYLQFHSHFLSSISISITRFGCFFLHRDLAHIVFINLEAFCANSISQSIKCRI